MTVWEQIKDDFCFYRKLRPNEPFVGVAFDRYFLVVACYRFGHWACRLRVPVFGKLMRIFYVLSNAIISARIGTELRPRAVIGRRFEVHTSWAILVDNGVVIGDDCIINTGVVLANKANGRAEGVPKVGNGVTMGVGSKIVGGVTIGDNAFIGANAVVSRDVPPGHIAIGIPAQCRPLKNRATEDH
jgi:serine O-acetyltransferase